MSVFMVERALQGITMEALAEAQKAAIAKAEEMRSVRTDIRWPGHLRPELLSPQK